MASKRLCSRARVSALRASTNGFCGNSGAWTALETGSAEVAGPFGLVLGSSCTLVVACSALVLLAAALLLALALLAAHGGRSLVGGFG